MIRFDKLLSSWSISESDLITYSFSYFFMLTNPVYALKFPRFGLNLIRIDIDTDERAIAGVVSPMCFNLR